MNERQPWEPVDPLGGALHLLRMRGTFYCRTEATAPWAVEMPAFPDCLSFHVVTDGACWLEVPDAEPLLLRAGDLALVPHGRGHHLRSAPDVPAVGRVDRLPQHTVSEHYTVLRLDGGGAATTLVCGIIASEGPVARQILRALPPVVALERTSAMELSGALALLAAEARAMRAGGEAVITRLADIIVIQALREWLERDPAARSGWLGALQDDRIGRALAALHRDPGRAWSVASLAREAAMSRSAFAARFAELAGETPARYLARWRMQVAKDRLQAGGVGVAELAAQLGYRSEAAFSRAFKREVGVPPVAVLRGDRPSSGARQLTHRRRPGAVRSGPRRR